jgi:hypothetical protein
MLMALRDILLVVNKMSYVYRRKTIACWPIFLWSKIFSGIMGGGGSRIELGRFRLFLSMSIIDFFRLFSTISISVSMSIFFIIAISISIIFSQSCIYGFGEHVTWSFM